MNELKTKPGLTNEQTILQEMISAKPAALQDGSSDDGSASAAFDLTTLQRDFEALREKVAALERQEEEYDLNEDTDDDVPGFANGPRGHDVVDDLIWKWDARREVAREIIRKSKRLQRLKDKGKLDKVRRLNDEYLGHPLVPPPPPPPPPPLRTDTVNMLLMSELIPTLNEVRWSEFSSSAPGQLKPSNHVIDVLIGEPVVRWTRGNRIVAVSEPNFDGLDTSSKNLSQHSAKILPERIRINSKILLCFIERCHDMPGLFQLHERVVFLRPFKMLVHFQERLRQRYTNLLEKHKSEVSAESNPAFLKAATNVAVEAKSSLESTAKQTSTTETDIEIDVGPAVMTEVAEAIESQIALQHLGVLIAFIDRYIVARQEHISNPRCQNITFSDLWLLFRPGQVVIEANGNQAYRVFQIRTPSHQAVPPWETTGEHASIPDQLSQPLMNTQVNAAEPLPPPPPPPPQLTTSFELLCAYIDSDGFALGPVTRKFHISHFDSAKPITDLPIYPLQSRAAVIESTKLRPRASSGSPQSVEDQFISRGRDFVKMTSTRHAYYAGPRHGSRDFLEGQVVVDSSHYFVMNPEMVRPSLERWVGVVAPPPPADARAHLCAAECCSNDVVWEDHFMDLKVDAEYHETHLRLRREDRFPLFAMEQTIADVLKDQEAQSITDDEYLIMSDRVYGFVLRTRKWARLDLAHISKVYYGTDETIQSKRQEEIAKKTAFDDLVLPPGHREMILGLVAQHFREEEHHEVDIFQGKGKGLILLLHGAPGVGKTSTAEGVAEAFEKPLLQITCGDLGFTAKEVEEALERNFELASRWDCVLLLDEADVFLASRAQAVTGADLNRNALVAVFLRVLEYYTGILFLTTNRIGDFDEAFASRIHVSLEYPQLTEESTQTILDLNIRLIRERFKKNGRTIEIDEEGISFKVTNYWQRNQKTRLNGRQIRNACQTALALAEFDAQGGNHRSASVPEAKVVLRSKYFDTVLKAYMDFNKYLKNIYGISAEERAREKGLRAGDENSTATDFSQPQMSSLSPPTGGFPGAHLYQQNSQAPSNNQHNFQSAQPTHQMYQTLPQSLPSFHSSAQGQQTFVPMQNVNAGSQFYG